MPVLKALFGHYPFLKKLFADGGCQGSVFATGRKKAMPGLRVALIKRSDAATGFEVLLRRWVVERTFSWLSITLDGVTDSIATKIMAR